MMKKLHLICTRRSTFTSVNVSDIEKIVPEEFQFLENANVCQGKTKKLRDKHLVHHEFDPSQFMLVLKSRLTLFPRKLKSRWCDPFEVVCATLHGNVELRDPLHGGTSVVKEQGVKHYWVGGVHLYKSLIDLVNA